MKAMCSILLIAITLCEVARGDGKFFAGESVPVGVPYQRAILHYEEGKETLILQSKYETVDGETAPTLAWVVPVPAVPELASMEAKVARTVFMMTDWGTGPKVISISLIVIGILLLIAVIISIAGICVVIFAGQSRLAHLIKNARPFTLTPVTGMLSILALLVVLALFMPTLGVVKGVDVVKAESVGIYEAKVIKGDSGAAIAEWLKENGFGYGKAEEAIFDDYAKDGWCFVAAKVSTKADPNAVKPTRDGLADPLILRFDVPKPVYPMRLTGTAQNSTEVVLYVFADHKMDCGGKLKVTYADKKQWLFSGDNNFRYYVEPVGFWGNTGSKTTFKTKFKGKLTPEQMKQDIVFTPAKNDEPYREYVYGW